MESAICEYYSNVSTKPVEWLWYPYIPFGKLTIIQGDPGEGKSTFVLNLIALLTKGLSMPDGYPVQTPGVAIYQCAEDGVADTIKPRLEQSDQPAKEVYESLADMGIGSRTVEKVKKELQITAYRSGGCWYWKLPTKEGMRRNG